MVMDSDLSNGRRMKKRAIFLADDAKTLGRAYEAFIQ